MPDSKFQIANLKFVKAVKGNRQDASRATCEIKMRDSDARWKDQRV